MNYTIADLQYISFEFSCLTNDDFGSNIIDINVDKTGDVYVKELRDKDSTLLGHFTDKDIEEQSSNLVEIGLYFLNIYGFDVDTISNNQIVLVIENAKNNTYKTYLIEKR